MKRLQRITAAAVTLVTASASAPAALLGTEPVGSASPGFGAGYSFDPQANLVIAASFTLNQSVPLGAITVYVSGDGTSAPQDQFKVELTNLIGPSATPANLLFSGTGTFPNSLQGGHDPVSVATPVTLAAGTYYIVLSSAKGQGSHWGIDAAVLPSTLGTVGDFGYIGFGVNGGVGDYRNIDPVNGLNESRPNFLVTAVPEPQGFLILPAFALWSLRRRRMRTGWFAGLGIVAAAAAGVEPGVQPRRLRPRGMWAGRGITPPALGATAPQETLGLSDLELGDHRLGAAAETRTERAVEVERVQPLAPGDPARRRCRREIRADVRHPGLHPRAVGGGERAFRDVGLLTGSENIESTRSWQPE